MNHRGSGKSKTIALGLALAALVAAPMGASAFGHRGHGDRGSYGHHGYYRGGYGHHGGHAYRGGFGYNGGHAYRGGYGYNGGYRHHGGYSRGGNWVAGALVTGAVVGLVANSLRTSGYDERPRYYERPRVVYGQPSVVYYNQPTRVIYENERPVTRVVETRRTVVYDDPYDTRYVRDDGYDGE